MLDRKIYGDWILDWQFSAPSFEDGNKLIYGNDKEKETNKMKGLHSGLLKRVIVFIGLLVAIAIIGSLCFAEVKSFKRGSNVLDYEFRSIIYYDDADSVNEYYDYKQICLDAVNGPRLRYKKAEFVLDNGAAKNKRHIDEDPMTKLDVCKQIMLTYGYMINEYVLVGKTYITEYFLIGKDKIAIRQWIVK